MNAADALALPRAILGAIRRVVGFAPRPVPLHEPLFRGKEWEYVKECIDTGWVSSAGPFVDRFEEMLREITGATDAVATVNGTSALHLALRLAGVTPGDEVLVPALTFVATANAVLYCGATPHFVDSSLDTLGVDPVRLADRLREATAPAGNRCVNRRTGRTVRALVVVHVFGHPADLDPLSEVCARHRIVLVEDAAESLGSLYKGRHTGTFGRLGALSFNGNKVVTTGGGGAVLSNDPRLGRLARHLSTTAKIPHPWEYRHDAVGYNYRLPNLNAALGCAQLEALPALLARKRELAAAYARAFDGLAGATFFREPPFARSNHWLNALLLDDAFRPVLGEVLALTHEDGFLTRPAWNLLPGLPMYRECPSGDLSAAEGLVARLLNLPSGPSLGKDATNA